MGTTLAGAITAIVFLLAIYLLASVFFYISNSSLSAVIIHALGHLITHQQKNSILHPHASERTL